MINPIMRLIATISAVLTLLTLSGCGCDHQFQEATCQDPQTCSRCGETVGDALGHTWMDATCTSPRTCSRCREIIGLPLGHSFSSATCTQGGVCSYCGQTSSPLNHSWVKATCSAPRTCSQCGATEGSSLGHVGHCVEETYCNVCGSVIAPSGHNYVGDVCATCGDEFFGEVILPSVPQTLHRTTNKGVIDLSCIIDDISYDFEKGGNGAVIINLYFSGTKTYFAYDFSDFFSIKCKLYNSDGAVITSDVAFTPELLVGESFSKTSVSIPIFENMMPADKLYYLSIFID